MDPFSQDAYNLKETLKLLEPLKPPSEVLDGVKNGAVIALCARIEQVLRVVDGQDISQPFDGRMRHREMAAALTKLDEVRMWEAEHLRVRGQLEAQQHYAHRVSMAMQAMARPPVPLEGALGDGGSYKITEGPAPEDVQAKVDYWRRATDNGSRPMVCEGNTPIVAEEAEPAEGEAAPGPMRDGTWTREEVEAAQIGHQWTTHEPRREPPSGYKWHMMRVQGTTGAWRHTLIPIA